MGVNLVLLSNLCSCCIGAKNDLLITMFSGANGKSLWESCNSLGYIISYSTRYPYSRVKIELKQSLQLATILTCFSHPILQLFNIYLISFLNS